MLFVYICCYLGEGADCRCGVRFAPNMLPLACNWSTVLINPLTRCMQLAHSIISNSGCRRVGCVVHCNFIINSFITRSIQLPTYLRVIVNISYLLQSIAFQHVWNVKLKAVFGRRRIYIYTVHDSCVSFASFRGNSTERKTILPRMSKLN